MIIHSSLNPWLGIFLTKDEFPFLFRDFIIQHSRLLPRSPSHPEPFRERRMVVPGRRWGSCLGPGLQAALAHLAASVCCSFDLMPPRGESGAEKAGGRVALLLFVA